MAFFDTLPPLPTPDEMTRWDQEAQSLGIDGIVLMETASQQAVRIIHSLFPDLEGKTIALFAGGGSNGGDAISMARHLHELGSRVTLYLAKDMKRYRGLAQKELAIAQNLGLPVASIDSFFHTPAPFMAIDGLLGTGFTKPLRDDLSGHIAAINAASLSHVISIDLPSGLDGETGKPSPLAIHAEHTICMEAVKRGLLLPHAKAYTGTLHVAPIALPRIIRKKYPPSSHILDASLFHHIPPLPPNSYKQFFGHVLVIGGGDESLTGAAHLASYAALRAGAGLVTVALPRMVAQNVRMNVPEIMLCPLETENGKWPCKIPENLRTLLPRITAILIGPGMGLGEDALSFLSEILSLCRRPPCVLDADALTILSRNSSLLSLIQESDCITPHPGEAARLLEQDSHSIQENRYSSLERLTQIQKGVAILKGASTLIGQRGKPVLLSPHDLPSLAVAGSGDVLGGILAAFLGSRRFPSDMEARSLFLGALAVLAHSLSAKSTRGYLAHEIADSLPHVLASHEKV